jgi:phospholipase/carboxylesterase
MNYTFPHNYIYKPSPSGKSKRAFLLLHGTGGDENDLIPIASQLDPNAAVLGVRGNVVENGMPRFFQRLSEGVFDEADIVQRANELASFLKEVSESYSFSLDEVIAIGYSNGANIATALHFLNPGLISKSIHFRPMTPLEPDTPPNLTNTQVFLSFGAFDQLMPRGEEDRLSQMYVDYGASITKNVEPTGHQLAQNDLHAAAKWLNTIG